MIGLLEMENGSFKITMNEKDHQSTLEDSRIFGFECEKVSFINCNSQDYAKLIPWVGEYIIISTEVNYCGEMESITGIEIYQ